MSLGLLDMIGLATAFAFAAPLAHFGVLRLQSGDPLGWAFLAVAALIVVVEQYLTTPGDVPSRIAERVVGGAVEEED